MKLSECRNQPHAGALTKNTAKTGEVARQSDENLNDRSFKKTFEIAIKTPLDLRCGLSVINDATLKIYELENENEAESKRAGS